MKKYLFLLFVVLSTSTTLFGQSVRTIEQIDESLYRVLIKDDGNLSQTGYYLADDFGQLLVHGEWKMFSMGNVVVRGKFNEGKLVWLQPTGQPRISAEEIKIKKLESKITRLEKMLLTSN